VNKIKYIQRTRDLYRAQGFQTDYVWASNEDIPFTPLSKPISECTVAIVTTGVVEHEIPKPSRAAKSYSLSDLPANLNTDELAWDKVSTHTDDRQSYFPLEVLEELSRDNKIGKLAPRFHFVPTDYSQRNTLEEDAPSILKACREDSVDIAILIPL
jgi:D-proline reductase (dithiol) PrdB